MEDKGLGTKYKILQSAAQVINRLGAASMTMEAVAKEAGISKGGLLYHFPYKEELFRGMNDYLMSEYIRKVKESAAKDSVEKGKWLRAYLNETINQLNKDHEMTVAFFSAAAAEPSYFSSMKNQMKELEELIKKDQIDPLVGAMIKLAVDGIYYNEVFNQSSASKKEKKEVISFLLSLTKGESR